MVTLRRSRCMVEPIHHRSTNVPVASSRTPLSLRQLTSIFLIEEKLDETGHEVEKNLLVSIETILVHCSAFSVRTVSDKQQANYSSQTTRQQINQTETLVSNVTK